MRKIISQTSNITKKDIVNSRSSEALKDRVEEELKIVKAMKFYDDEPEDGESKVLSVFVTEDSEYMSSISESIYETLDDIITIIEEEGFATIKVKSRVSKGNQRQFLTIIVL